MFPRRALRRSCRSLLTQRRDALALMIAGIMLLAVTGEIRAEDIAAHAGLHERRTLLADDDSIFANGFEFFVIGVATVPVPRADACMRADGRTCESLVGDVTADAIREGSGAEFAIMNAGGLRASLTCPETDDPIDSCPPYMPPPYPITPGQVLAVLPFGNIAVTVLVTGAELKLVLENAISKMPLADGRFAQISGLCFTYDTAAAVGSRILGAVRMEGDGCTGAAINFSAGVAYVLAENDFTAGGGDGYPNFTGRTTALGTLSQLVIDYVKLHTPITPSIDGRITCTTSGVEACPVQ